VRRLVRDGNPNRTVAVFGVTFKENVPDIRNSKVIDIVRELEAFGLTVQVTDPLADPKEVLHEYGIVLTAEPDLKPAGAVVLAVAHDAYRQRGWALVEDHLCDRAGLVLDVKACLDRTKQPDGIDLWRL